jgi:peptidyl-prolyl cis-trans isomerase SurA
LTIRSSSHDRPGMNGRPKVPRIFAAALFFLWLIPPLRSEIIDRVVAVVDNRIITLSDLRKERIIRTALQEPAPADDQALLNELIERSLMITQLTDFTAEPVTDEEIASEMQRITDRRGLSEETLREAVAMRLRLMRYIDVRFAQFIRITNEELRAYYENTFLPEARNRGLNPVPGLEQIADTIRTNVRAEKLDQEITVWLEAMRRRSEIEIYN